MKTNSLLRFAMIVLPFAMIGGCSWLEYRAEAKANAFCERYRIGEADSEVRKAIQNSGADRIEFKNPKSLFVMYTGATLFSRHFCDIEIENAKIVSVKYVYLD